MVEGDGGAERMADQDHVFAREPGHEILEVVVEGAHLAGCGVFGIAVAPEIEGVDGSARR